VTREDKRDGAWLGLALLAWGLLVAPGMAVSTAGAFSPARDQWGTLTRLWLLNIFKVQVLGLSARSAVSALQLRGGVAPSSRKDNTAALSWPTVLGSVPASRWEPMAPGERSVRSVSATARAGPLFSKVGHRSTGCTDGSHSFPIGELQGERHLTKVEGAAWAHHPGDGAMLRNRVLGVMGPPR
jgi:hypothetical protein